MNVLDIDIGNSFFKWRYTPASGRVQRGRCLSVDYAEQLADVIKGPVERVRIASVASQDVSKRLADWCQARWAVTAEFAVTAASAAGVTNSYEDPARMGVDRWLAMIAAYRLQQGSCWVVDCGSAITIEQLSDDGRHLGGFIVPGMPLMAKNLLNNTAQIIVDNSIDEFECRPGTDTSSAVQHGLNWVFRAVARQLAAEVDQPVYVTGGDGELFCQFMQSAAVSCRYYPELVLDGLAEVLN